MKPWRQKHLVVPEVTAASLLGVTLSLWCNTALEVSSLGVDAAILLAIRLVAESPAATSTGLTTHSITANGDTLWLVVTRGHGVSGLAQAAVAGWAVLNVPWSVLLLIDSALWCWRVISIGEVWVEVLAESSSLGVLSLLWLWVGFVTESPRAATLFASHSVAGNVDALLLHLTLVGGLLAATHAVTSNCDTLLLNLMLIDWLLAGSHAVAGNSDAILEVALLLLALWCWGLILEFKVSLCVLAWLVDVWSADWRLWYLVVLRSPMANVLTGLWTDSEALGWDSLSWGVEVVKGPAGAALGVLLGAWRLRGVVRLAGVGARGDIEVLELLWIWLVDLISAIGCDWGVLVVVENTVGLEVLAGSGLRSDGPVCGVLVWGIWANLWLGIRIVSDEQVMVIALRWLRGCARWDNGWKGLLGISGIAWSKKGKGGMWIARNIRRVLAGAADFFLTRLLLCWSWNGSSGGPVSCGVDAVDNQLDLVLSIANWPVAPGLSDDIDELEKGSLVPAESDLGDLSVIKGNDVDLGARTVSLRTKSCDGYLGEYSQLGK